MPSYFPISSNREEFEKFNKEKNCVGVYTELIIDAPPSVVRSKFLDFEQRTEWDPFFRKIEVIKGSLDLESDDDVIIQPALKITLDMNMDGSPSKCFKPVVKVYQNDQDSLVWGIRFTPCGYGLACVDHAHLFLPFDNNGAVTKFVHYERFGGAIGRLLLLIDKDQLTNAYDTVNQGLKKVSEEDEAACSV